MTSITYVRPSFNEKLYELGIMYIFIRYLEFSKELLKCILHLSNIPTVYHVRQREEERAWIRWDFIVRRYLLLHA